jgi:hypothetical protein
MHCIEQETGNTLSFPVKEVPSRWIAFLPDIEKVLSGLSRKERAPESAPLPPHVKPSEFLDSEFFEFCNGEYDSVVAMSMRSPQHTAAQLFLNDFFEDWTYTSDNGSDSIRNKALTKRVEYLEMIERESSLGLTSEQEAELHKLRGLLTA